MSWYGAPMSTSFRRARPSEAQAISELALRSKAHWGYDEAFLAACREDLTWTAEGLESQHVVVAESGGELAGFFALDGHGASGELTDLFVDPRWIGTGLGGELMSLALEHARDRGHATLGIDADPNAASFYERFGARLVSQSMSRSIPGRTLPRLEIVL